MMKYLVDVKYPDADIVQVVMDNLNTPQSETTGTPARASRPHGQK